ncbi:MAG: chemotaxis protein CheB [Cyanobacteria bacterium P01_D01_bin.156]
MNSSANPSVAETPIVVGIGASAGGLHAIEVFFDTMRCDSDAAFVVVQHLLPDYKRLMSELLERRTQMDVCQVTDGIELKPNTIFLIPPGQNLILKGEQLRLIPQNREQGDQPHFPIDLFFQSLAAEQGDRTIGIMLSGTGSDGTRGLQEISETGGLVLVQDPKTAEFDGMPQSAIANGIVDLVLSPSELAQATYEFVTTPSSWQRLRSDQQPPLEQSQMQQIVNIVKEHSDIDFTYYKPSSISRRIRRRCLITGYTNLDSYITRLELSETERDTLRNDLLISVTGFFRDSSAWRTLETQILPELIANADVDTPIRIWVAACATGEEAYSMGILLRELLDKAELSLEAKIFATDIDPIALDKASAGMYPTSIRSELSPQRLKKFFVEKDGYFEVHRSIREMIIFANHNLAKDAGFTNMDVVTCRNVLIYMQPKLQQRVLRSLHFALNVKGILFLGESETLGNIEKEFVPLQRKWKLYQKRRNIPLPPMELNTCQLQLPSSPNTDRAASICCDPLIEIAFRHLLSQQKTTCVLLDRQNQLLHVCGDDLNLLQIPDGRASRDALKLFPKDLQRPISTALYQARQHREQVEYRGCQMANANREINTLTIAASLHSGNRPIGDFLMILVKQDVVQPLSDAPAQFEANSEAAQYILQLEHELQQTRENLQATVEELESTNEELIASHKELQSTNEELQSTEELVNARAGELQKANQRLQAEIEERQQIEKKLAQRASELSLSNAGLEQFAYGVSHDLQEPLRAMTVFSQLLHQRYQNQLDATATSYIDNIVKGGIRMKSMIDGILALSRIDKEVSKTIVPVDLQKPLDMALENLKVICVQRKPIITQDPLPSLPVEQHHIVQLFQNLIGNAIKFCQSTPEVHIIAQPQSHGYLFGIKDNGPAISEQDRERIFQLFQRLHTRQEYDGYGIGLAICKKIVQRYDGRIWLEANAEQGNTFYFNLFPRNPEIVRKHLSSKNNADINMGDTYTSP